MTDSLELTDGRSRQAEVTLRLLRGREPKEWLDGLAG